MPQRRFAVLEGTPAAQGPRAVSADGRSMGSSAQPMQAMRGLVRGRRRCSSPFCSSTSRTRVKSFRSSRPRPWQGISTKSFCGGSHDGLSLQQMRAAMCHCGRSEAFKLKVLSAMAPKPEGVDLRVRSRSVRRSLAF